MAEKPPGEAQGGMLRSEGLLKARSVLRAREAGVLTSRPKGGVLGKVRLGRSQGGDGDEPGARADAVEADVVEGLHGVGVAA